MSAAGGFSPKEPRQRIDTSAVGRENPENPLKNPGLQTPAGWLASSLADSILNELEDILSQPGSQPEAPLSPCEYLEDRWLCLRMDAGHLLNPSHMRRVFAFLEARGVRRASVMARMYSAVAINAYARSLESKELEGIDWTEELASPGAFIHNEIRELSNQLRMWYPDAG